MSIQDQYIDTVRQTQQAWTGIVESLTENVQSFGKQSPFPTVDPTEAIDQVFDFWGKTLETQREVAKQLVGATVAAGERVRTQAEEFGSVVREQAEQVTGAAREQAEAAREQAEAAEKAERAQAEAAEKAERAQAAAARRAEREQVKARYEDLTKVELQDALASRELPKTGNVDELRERLVADDLK
jgi:membrane protein involved in colicin uptake